MVGCKVLLEMRIFIKSHLYCFSNKNITLMKKNFTLGYCLTFDLTQWPTEV